MAETATNSDVGPLACGGILLMGMGFVLFSDFLFVLDGLGTFTPLAIHFIKSTLMYFRISGFGKETRHVRATFFP